MRKLAFLFPLFLAGTGVALADAPAYTPTALQGVSPLDSVEPSGVSTAGPVGFSVNVGGGLGAAVVYPAVWQGGQAQLLALPQGYYGQARGAAGAYAVGSVWPTAFNPLSPQPGTYGQPAVWSGGQLQVLTTLNEPSGEALAVNAGGTAVGELDSEGDPASEFQAVIWMQGQATVLGSFPSAQAEGVAINNHGDAVVQVDTGQSSSAYIWSGGTLSPIPSLGSTYLVATGINDSGHVVGSVSADGNTGSAFVYQDGITAPLAALPGDIYENALAINNSDEIVGVGTDASGTSRAVLWEDGKVIDLNTMLPANSGWFLSEATAISDDGIIVGEGGFDGQEMGFELTPGASPSEVPEPAPLGVLALCGLALLRRRGLAGNDSLHRRRRNCR